MPKIEKLPSGSYRMRVYVGRTPEGRPIQKSITAGTKRELKLKASVYLAERPEDMSELTVSEAIQAFLDSCRATLSPSTIRGYAACQRAFEAYPRLMSMRINDLTKRDVQMVIDAMCLSGSSAKTVRNRYSFLSAALKRYEIALQVRLPARQRPSVAVPDDSVMRNIIVASRGTGLHVPILLAAIGGLRRGEICALTLEDIMGTVIHVHADMVYSPEKTWVVKEIPKTYDSNRFVEMPKEVIDLIRQQGYVCNLTPQSLTQKHARFLAKHGFPDFRLHDYRHHMVSALHAAGIPDAYIMQRGGWSSDYVMKTVYRHTLADHEKEAVDATIEHFEALLK